MFFVLKNGVLPLMEVDGRDGALPTRRYGEGESSAVPLKIRAWDLPAIRKTKTSAIGAGIFVDCIRK
jgi:hypothetical protein